MDNLENEEYIRKNYLQYPAYELAKNINCSTSTIINKIKTMGLNRDQDRTKYILENYNNFDTKDIAKYLNCTPEAVSSIAKKHKVKKIFQLRNSFFDNWSSNMAYILGFTIGDGCVLECNKDYRLQYGIHTKDISVLEYINKNISNNKYKIYTYKKIDKLTNKTKEISNLCISSKHIFTSLNNLGVYSRKTGQEILPNIPEEFKGCFLAGYHDADGYLNKGLKNSPYFEFTCGSKEFLENLNREVCFGWGTIYKNRTYYRMMIGGRNRCNQLDSFMIQNRDFYLKRKHFG